jgi:hypothetical protein
MNVQDRIQWEYPRSSGTLIVRAKTGHDERRLVFPMTGR